MPGHHTLGWKPERTWVFAVGTLEWSMQMTSRLFFGADDWLVLYYRFSTLAMAGMERVGGAEAHSEGGKLGSLLLLRHITF